MVCGGPAPCRTPQRPARHGGTPPLSGSSTSTGPGLEEFLYGGDPKGDDSAEILPFVTAEQIANETYAVVNVRVDTASVGVAWEITSSVDGTVWSSMSLVELQAVDLGNGILLKGFRMSVPLPDPGASRRLFRVGLDD